MSAVISAVPGNDAGCYEVKVDTRNGISNSQRYDRIFPIRSVSSVAPSSGPFDQRRKLFIKGSGFAGTTHVRFQPCSGGVFHSSPNVRVYSDTEMAVVADPVPESATGCYRLWFVPGYGSASYEYGPALTPSSNAAVPVITGLAPSDGPIAGGTNLTIDGANFVANETTVLIDGLRATAVNVESPTRLSAVTPAVPSSGTVRVLVQTPAGGDSDDVSAAYFTYFTQKPIVALVAPSDGPIAGGTNLIIDGANFVANETTVLINGLRATAVNVESPTRLSAVTPAVPSSGTVRVLVQTPAGGDSDEAAAASFIYFAPPPPIAALTITPSNPSIAKGRTQALTATGTYEDGSTADLTMLATWSSSDAAVATISQDLYDKGTAAAVAEGTTKITAVLDGSSATTVLTVTPPALAALAVSPSDAAVTRGASQQMTATGTFSDGSTSDVTSSVNWSSSDTSVATVSPGGTVTAVAEGSSTISASRGSISGAVRVTVTAPVLAGLTLSPANPTVPKNTAQQITATGTYSDGSTADFTSSVVWASSDTSVATISAGGLLTAVVEGSATVSATLGPNSAATTVTVGPPALVSIGVTPAHVGLAKGATQQMAAVGTYSDGSNADLTPSVSWTSSDPSIAVISTAGLATALAEGRTNIAAVAGSVSGTTTLTVGRPTLLSIAVRPSNTTVAESLTQQLSAFGTYTDGSTEDVTSSMMWSSSDISVATISAGGLVSALAPGTTTITATRGPISGATALAVVPLAADLAVDVTAPSTAKKRSLTTYTITVANQGPWRATNVVLTDQLPYGTGFEGLTPPPGWSCTTPARGKAGTITCRVASMQQSTTASTSLVVKFTARADNGVVHNVVRVTSDTPDPNTVNNSASATTAVG